MNFILYALQANYIVNDRCVNFSFFLHTRWISQKLKFILHASKEQQPIVPTQFLPQIKQTTLFIFFLKKSFLQGRERINKLFMRAFLGKRKHHRLFHGEQEYIACAKQVWSMYINKSR